MRKKLLLPGPRRLKVRSRRNSESSAPLENLDWSRWWTDSWTNEGIAGITHLKVPHADKKGGWAGTVHRVYCRHSDKPRLQMWDGELYWLVDRT